MPEDKGKTTFKTFQESAKKFKPGPAVQPEAEEEGPDMSGAVHGTRAKSVRSKQAPPDPAHGEMSEGAPGQLKKMPGE